MTEPILKIRAKDLTRTGSLKTRNLLEIRKILERRGFVVLPSDTCYSLAASSRFPEISKCVNIILHPRNMPISLSASSYEQALKFIELNETANKLLETFTPGPITVVCNGRGEGAFNPTAVRTVLGSNDGTVGIRIPDSVAERQVASLGGTKYLITTPAVTKPGASPDDDRGPAVRDFDEALEIVQQGMERLSKTEHGSRPWGAVEGFEFDSNISTVVIVEENGNIKEHRKGAISFSEIERAAAGAVS